MGKVDHLMKVYFSNPYVFADVFNFWLHDGVQIIQPENLRETSGSLISLSEKSDAMIARTQDITNEEEFETLSDIESSERIRDVLMHLICMEDGESVYALLGIEGQTYVDYALVARALIYDARQFDKQLKEISDQHKAKGERGNSPGEFLWRFFKTDHLVPVITVVIYLGTDDWDGPRTLRELFQTKNPVLLNHGVDYKLNLIEPLRMSEMEIEKFQTDMREVMLYMKAANDPEKLMELAEKRKFREVDRVTAHLINEVSKSKIKIKKGKVKIDMCKAIEGIREDAIKRGIEQGIEMGLRQSAFKMAAKGMSVSIISQIMEKREDTIEKWIAEAVIGQ